jgi:hypothetical protein
MIWYKLSTKEELCNINSSNAKNCVFLRTYLRKSIKLVKMKKLVTLVMIAAATTFAMTSCGGGEEASSWADAVTEGMNEAVDAANEEMAVPEEAPVVDEVPADVDTTAAMDEVPAEEPMETTE